MTISSENRKSGPYDGNDVTTSFPFSFKVFSDDEVVVVFTDEDGVETILSSGYSVTLNADQNANPGGSVEKSTALETGAMLTITSAVQNLQPIDLTNNGGFYPAVINQAFDRLTILAQQNAEQISRAVKTPISSGMTPDELLASIASSDSAAAASASEAAASASDALSHANDAEASAVASAASVDALADDLASTDDGKGAELVAFAQAGTGAVQRTTQDKLREFVSPEDFGAVGDGVTDDSAAFNLAGASDAKEIMASKNYVITGVDLYKKRLTGGGKLIWKSASSESMLTIYGENSCIDGMEFDGNESGQTTNLTMINLQNAPNSSVINNSFSNGRHKLFSTDVANSYGAIIAHNKVKNWGTQSNCNVFEVRSPDARITGNSVDTMLAAGHCVRLGLFDGDATTVPVTGCVVSSNVFKNTLHVGVTGEIYANGLTISDNVFDTLNQAIKLESAGDTVFDVSITGNVIKNIAGETALNLSANNVSFIGNHCKSMAGGPYFGNDFIAANNYFDSCGSASAACISNSSSSVRAVISGNVIKGAPYRAIAVEGNATITGNSIFTTGGAAIRVSGSGSVITGNLIDGAVNFISTNSTLTDSIIKDNFVKNISGAAFSAFSYNANFASVLVRDNIGAGEVSYTHTISSDAITVSATDALVVIDTEGAASTDDLSTISGGRVGQIIVLRTSSVSRDVTVKDTVGNIRLAGDCLLDTTSDTITLQFDQSLGWVELCRSNNA